jgi:ABC-type polysaccharide/polyol phosphate export permease
MGQIADIARSRNLLWNLTLRELRAKYRRSLLGWSWSMLNPLAQLAIYSFVFGVLFGVEAPVGDPSGVSAYGLYLLSGLIPWGFFSLVCGMGLEAVISNSNLVRKVAFARECLVVSQVLFAVVQFSIEMSLVCVVLVVAGSPLLAWLPVTLLLMALLAAFAGGIALILSVGAVFFRDLPYLWTILQQVWFFATPVIYDQARFDQLSNPVARAVLHWNPTAVFLRAFRDVTYHGRGPVLADLVVLACVAAASVFVGLRVFARYSRRLAEEL